MFNFELCHTCSQYHIIVLVSCAIIKFESMENSKMDKSNQNNPTIIGDDQKECTKSITNKEETNKGGSISSDLILDFDSHCPSKLGYNSKGTFAIAKSNIRRVDKKFKKKIL